MYASWHSQCFSHTLHQQIRPEKNDFGRELGRNRKNFGRPAFSVSLCSVWPAISGVSLNIKFLYHVWIASERKKSWLAYVKLKMTGGRLPNWGFPCGSVVKNSPANAEDLGSISGLGRSPGEEMATHSSILACKIPWTEEPGGWQSMGSQRVRHNWAMENIHNKDTLRDKLQ